MAMAKSIGPSVSNQGVIKQSDYACRLPTAWALIHSVARSCRECMRRQLCCPTAETRLNTTDGAWPPRCCYMSNLPTRLAISLPVLHHVLYAGSRPMPSKCDSRQPSPLHPSLQIAKRLLREVRLPHLQQLASAPPPPVAPARAAFSYASAMAAAASGGSMTSAIGKADQLPEGGKSVGELWLLLVDAIVGFEQLMLPHLGEWHVLTGLVKSATCLKPPIGACERLYSD